MNGENILNYTNLCMEWENNSVDNFVFQNSINVIQMKPTMDPTTDMKPRS